MCSKVCVPLPADPYRVLITGCLGNIGRTVSARMIQAGWTVEGIDLPQRRGETAPSEMVVHYLDLGNGGETAQVLSKILCGFDGVIHLAGYSRVGQSATDPLGAIRSNIVASTNLLEAIRISERQPWLLFASSLEVKVTARGAYGFTNMYGLTKSIVELLSRRYASDYGLRVAAARIAGVYGDVDDYKDKIPLVFIRNAVMQLPLRVRKSRQRLNYVHVDAVCAMLLEGVRNLATTPRGTFAVFYVRSGRGISLLNLAKRVLRIARSKASIIEFEEQDPVNNPLVHWNIEYPGPELDHGLEEMVEQLRYDGLSPSGKRQSD
jgi:UDP-glucose 4-epimerase